MSKTLIALVVITLVVALIILVLLGLLLTGIRREDRAPELAIRPPTWITALTRHLVGLHVRRLPDPDSTSNTRPSSCPACGTNRAGDSA